MKISTYFNKLKASEYPVEDFQYLQESKEVSFAMDVSFPRDVHLATITESEHNADEESEFTDGDLPIDEAQKLTFSGVSCYQRKVMTFDESMIKILPESELWDIERRGAMKREIFFILSEVENIKHENYYEFKALFVGFGLVSFRYTDLKIVAKKMEERGEEKDGLTYIYHRDAKTGVVGKVPDLFVADNISPQEVFDMEID